MIQSTSTFTTMGRAALYEYMVEALSPGSNNSGLNRNAIMTDPNITDNDLSIMVRRVADINMMTEGKYGEGNREQLVDQLVRLLDRAALRPQALVNDVEPVLRSSHQGPQESGANTLRHQTRREHAAGQGQSGNVTQRVLRNARRVAGWIPISNIRLSHTGRERILNQLMDQYISARMADGMTHEEAEQHMSKHYIAVTQRYRVVGSKMDESGHWVHRVDKERPTVRWVDLSPLAVADFEREASQEKESTGPNSDLHAIYYRTKFPYDEEKAVALAQKLREQEIARHMDLRGMDREAAQKKTDEEYLAINIVQDGDRYASQVTLSPRARVDVERELINQIVAADIPRLR